MIVVRPGYYFLSFHGTLLAVDKTKNLPCHRPITEHNQNFDPIRINVSSSVEALFGLPVTSISLDQDLMVSNRIFLDTAVAAGFMNKSISLKSRGGYWTAENKFFRLSCRADRCREWESFFLISSDDLDLLRHITSEAWLLQSTQSVMMPNRISVGSNFSFHIGEHVIDLPKNFPLNSKCTRDHFELLPVNSTQGPIIGDLATKPAKPGSSQKRIWIDPQGNMGNRALQYLAAEGIRARVPGAEIENINLPEWGIASEHPEPDMLSAVRIGRNRFSGSTCLGWLTVCTAG